MKKFLHEFQFKTVVWERVSKTANARATGLRRERCHQLHFMTYNAALRVTHRNLRHKLGHA